MLSFRKGLKDGVPIALGYVSVSFAFGMLAVEKGLPLWSPILLSITNFTGTGQFAGIDLIRSGAGLWEVCFTLLIINIRYVLLSLSLSQKLSPKITFLQRLLIAFGNTDEVFGISIQKTEPLTMRYMMGIILCSYAGWNAGTVLGVLMSSALPEMVRTALGIALYAMFIAIIVPPSRDSKPITKVILLSVLISCLLTFIPVLSTIGGGWRIIICGVISAGLAAFLFPLEIKDGDAQNSEAAK
jgi:4-azaleucine resistance transporter AzlC